MNQSSKFQRNYVAIIIIIFIIIIIVDAAALASPAGAIRHLMTSKLTV